VIPRNSTVVTNVLSRRPARGVVNRLMREVGPISADVAQFPLASGAEHASRLYAIDVTDAVPETVEASLQLSEATLMSLGLPAGAGDCLDTSNP
jgi:monovalent cation:H+ antiporter-2, CPA2 family